MTRDTPRAPAPAPHPGGGHPAVLAAVAAGGAVGAALRWTLLHGNGAELCTTFTINTVGALCLGVLTAWVARRRPRSRYLRPLLGTGVLGGFTTFSAVMVQTRGLLAAGRTGLALGYLLGTLAAATAAAWVGSIGAERAAAEAAR